MVLIKSIKTYVAQALRVTWRKLLTEALHRLYYAGVNCYELNVLNSQGADNP